ncbi:E3 ubiquitin-protein ligase MARCH2-like [Hibiscus syriacus]|uniref:E3 ubiquitin-protein ligase MARCH2-like n=1 Tax=Hibiscus syriacus TaxID=106335 RepID=A0A6A2WWW4_HIBSY|nr:protein EMBRYO DEFECTIVE 514-like [Hibiscus syriacus]KAE8665861.1 E3 ubiquitin-protein ligase MARCH2-like [Hibiscus syriacus]
MDTETLAPPAQNSDDGVDSKGVNNGDLKSKRGREEDGEGSDKASKKQMVEKSVEEESIENKKSEPSESGRVRLGPKEFGSSVEMFDYFYNLLHYWPTQFNLNKYEHRVMLELLKKGHEESDKKIGGGIKAFQIRIHPVWKSKCFFAIREDETVEDFSFRKCVDHILPLPDEMKKPNANRASGGGRSGTGGARGRGGKSRK